MSSIFCCPVCKGPLLATPQNLRCEPCARSFALLDGVPDFFISESEHDAIAPDDANRVWLDPVAVEARDTYYGLCARELKGMAFCMQEIGRRTRAGCRVLEVGTGTAHFTRWLAEVCEPGTEIYAFDFSWPMIERAKARIRGLSGITLFRANARGALPFEDGVFDIVLQRLAPLGPKGIPSGQAAFEMLKPGGWYFLARWDWEYPDPPPTEWMIQHGYECAEHHIWQYRRLQSAEERLARQTEVDCVARLRPDFADDMQAQLLDVGGEQAQDGGVWKMTHENVVVAQKPAS